MSRAPLPPDGSAIRVAGDDPAALSLRWLAPRGPADIGSFVSESFLLLWLGMWAFGEALALRHLLPRVSTPPDPFLLVWLSLWTLGGLGVISVVVGAFLPATESSLRLTREALCYRAGRMPPRVRAHRDTEAPDSVPMIPRRPAPIAIPRAEVRNPKLERVDGVLRLTVDRGADRIPIGPGLREPEPEWLHGILRDWIIDRDSPRAPSVP
jgi:hypothetical protein